MILAYSELGHILERHVGYKALNSKGAEGVLSEAWTTVSAGFPYYGVSPVLVYLGILLVIVLVIAYSVAGKGTGSHAGAGNGEGRCGED